MKANFVGNILLLKFKSQSPIVLETTLALVKIINVLAAENSKKRI